MMKSRMNWLSLGDRNTSFIHTSALNKCRKNRITRLMKNNSTWVTEPSEIENKLLTNLKNTYSMDPSTQQNYSLSNLNFSSLDSSLHPSLTNIRNEEEIRKVTFDIALQKTHGEDCLHALFYQENWDIIKHKLS